MDRTLCFSGEFTPRIDRTWTTNFLASASIRVYCWQRCACNFMPTRDNYTIETWMSPTASVWHSVATHDLTTSADGFVNLEASGSQPSERQVLPPQNRLSVLHHQAPAGTCGAHSRKFCSDALADGRSRTHPKGASRRDTDCQEFPKV